jgi:hypothetical protein
MSKTFAQGRLCNIILRNVAASFIAEKHNLYITYHDTAAMDPLGIPLFIGTNLYDTSIYMDEANYWDIYNMDSLTTNIHTNACFQTKECSQMFYAHVRKETVRKRIMDANPFHSRYGSNQDLFIHIRLGDVIQYNPGLAYYLKAIAAVPFEKLYIASDSPHHPIIQDICKTYPSASVVTYDPIQTIQFGSTCKNIILSHGTFSAVIGYLAYDSTVYYPPFMEGKGWHGDCFSIEGWTEVKML